MRLRWKQPWLALDDDVQTSLLGEVTAVMLAAVSGEVYVMETSLPPKTDHTLGLPLFAAGCLGYTPYIGL